MFFDHPIFRRNFPGGQDPTVPSSPFRAIYKCYSAAFLTDRDPRNIENGGKVLLPQAALEQLLEQVDERSHPHA